MADILRGRGFRPSWGWGVGVVCLWVIFEGFLFCSSRRAKSESKMANGRGAFGGARRHWPSDAIGRPIESNRSRRPRRRPGLHVPADHVRVSTSHGRATPRDGVGTRRLPRRRDGGVETPQGRCGFPIQFLRRFPSSFAVTRENPHGDHKFFVERHHCLAG